MCKTLRVASCKIIFLRFFRGPSFALTNNAFENFGNTTHWTVDSPTETYRASVESENYGTYSRNLDSLRITHVRDLRNDIR